jgi:phage-related protein
MDVFDLKAVLRLDSKDYDEGLNSAKKGAGSFGDMFKANIASSIVTKGFSMAVDGAKALGSAMYDFGRQAVESFSSYEQLVGGVETLFGAQGKTLEQFAKDSGKSVSEVKDQYNTLTEAQSIALKNADKAYATAGMSMNQYMETITSFAASLKQSTKDEVEAANVADVAIRDMSDNANKMGTSMESIQNAYQGFAKQNYTMLDNLKLGYGGTKTEMERLLTDAEKLSGVKYDINNLSDVYNAIHVIQNELGITGTTAEEAMHTIEGSANMTKAAWQNLITAIGRGEGIDEAIDNLMTALFGDGSSGSGLLANILPRIKTVIDGIGKFVSQAGPLIQKYVPPLLQELIPTLVKSVSSMVSAVVTALPDILSGIWESVKTVFGDLFQKIRDKGPELYEAADKFTQNMITATDTKLPDMLNKGVEAVKKFSEGMTKNGPEAIMNAAKIAGNVVVAIAKALPQILWAGVKMIFYLVKGLVSNIPTLLSALDQIIGQFLSALFGKIGEMIKPGLEAIKNFAIGLVKGIPNVISAIPKIILAAVQQFLGYDWGSVGRNIITGIARGIANGLTTIINAVKSIAKGALNAAKNFLGIRSPSRVFRDQVGKMIALGMGEGMEKNSPIRQAVDTVKSVISNAKDAISGIDIPIESVFDDDSLMPDDIVFESRDPGGNRRENSGDSITINVYPRENQDEEGIARNLRKELVRWENQRRRAFA